jgi:hypothetical protein
MKIKVNPRGRSTEPFPLVPLSVRSIPIRTWNRWSSPRSQLSGPPFPAFAGTMAVERVATAYFPRLRNASPARTAFHALSAIIAILGCNWILAGNHSCGVSAALGSLA